MQTTTVLFDLDGTLGMKVFLLPACLIDRENTDLSAFPHGGFDDLPAFARQLKGSEG